MNKIKKDLQAYVDLIREEELISPICASGITAIIPSLLIMPVFVFLGIATHYWLFTSFILGVVITIVNLIIRYTGEESE